MNRAADNAADDGASSDGDGRPVAPEIRQRLEGVLGRSAREWASPETGLSAAARYSVTLDGGGSVFVKAATDDQTAGWLRTEYLALRHVPERFTPRVVAWLDEPGRYPILVTEDLRHAHWPASDRGVDWRPGDIDRVLAAVADLSTVRAPEALAPVPRGAPRWPDLVRDGAGRDAFLGLGLCSAAWLDAAGPVLVEAEARLDTGGDQVVHGDLRSDNICLEPGRVVFVDWSSAARGSAAHDVAQLLPTLHLEGGPPPETVMPDGGRWAAAGCAALARRAVEDRSAPSWLVAVFVRLAAINLSWAASCFGLTPPDGVEWRAI